MESWATFVKDKHIPASTKYILIVTFLLFGPSPWQPFTVGPYAIRLPRCPNVLIKALAKWQPDRAQLQRDVSSIRRRKASPLMPQDQPFFVGKKFSMYDDELVTVGEKGHIYFVIDDVYALSVLDGRRKHPGKAFDAYVAENCSPDIAAKFLGK